MVTVEQALGEHGKEGVVFVDGSWHLGNDRDAREEYEAGPRIRGARFLDIDDVANTGRESNPKALKHMRPDTVLFAAAMDALGVGNDDRVIVYATAECPYAHRAAFTLEAYGHRRVHLLRGSLTDWTGPTDDAPAAAVRAADLNLSRTPAYAATDPAPFFCDLEDVRGFVARGPEASGHLVVDARSAARFAGEAPEPRPGVRGGRMPGSVNVPFASLLDDRHDLRPVHELTSVFAAAGVDPVATDKTLVLSCGSGVTACVVESALRACGRDPSHTLVYDGSWADWGTEDDTPIV